MGKGPGRPKVKLDWDEIGKLLTAGCKTVSIAEQFGVAVKTLYDRCEEDNNIGYALFSQEMKSKGDNLLQAAQFKNAMGGNTSMQIWLGKQRLGQKEKEDPVSQPPNDQIITLQNQLMELQALLIKNGIHYKPQTESELPGSNPQV